MLTGLLAVGKAARRCYLRPIVGGLAQLGERRLCKAEVIGSIPLSSIAQTPEVIDGKRYPGAVGTMDLR